MITLAVLVHISFPQYICIHCSSWYFSKSKFKIVMSQTHCELPFFYYQGNYLKLGSVLAQNITYSITI